MAGADTTREDDELAEDQEVYKHAREAFSDNYDRGLESFRFARYGEQWPEAIRRDRELEGRPCLTINRLPAFIRQVVNDARQNKPAITVHPVDSYADPETAEIFNGLIRHIEQSSDADVAYDTALDHAVTGGFGYWQINTRYATDDTFEQDIVVEPIPNCFSVTPDGNSTSADSADWMDAFVADAMTKADFEARWQGADPVSWDAVKGLSRTPAAEDDRVSVVARWKREKIERQIVALSPPSMEAPVEAVAEFIQRNLLPENLVVDLKVYQDNKDLFDALGVTIIGKPRPVPSFKVVQKMLSGADVLETNDWAGRYIPIISVYGEDINVEGERRLNGLVFSSMDAQRMFNYWRTTSTELVALAPKAPFIGKVGQFVTDGGKWASANTQTHAFLEYDVPEGSPDAGPPQRQPFSGVPAGALQEALNASDDMKSIMGLHDASLGAKSNETSGRAIMARQREGDVSTFNYIDNLNRAMRHAGRVMLDLIPKVYSTPRIVRIIGPDDAAQSVQIKPGAPRAPTPQTDEPTAANPQQAEAEKIERIYDLTVGKYDLTVRAGPSFTSRREEAASQMVELIRAYPAVAPVIGDLLAKNLDWPGADEIAERMKAMLPAQLQGENPEMMAQVKQMSEIIGQLKGKLAAAEADKSIEQRKVEIDAYGAETNRLKAIAGKDGAPYDQGQMSQVVAESLFHVLSSPDILEAAAGGAGPQELAAMLSAKMGQQQQQPSDQGAAPPMAA